MQRVLLTGALLRRCVGNRLVAGRSTQQMSLSGFGQSFAKTVEWVVTVEGPPR